MPLLPKKEYGGGGGVKTQLSKFHYMSHLASHTETLFTTSHFTGTTSHINAPIALTVKIIHHCKSAEVQLTVSLTTNNMTRISFPQSVRAISTSWGPRADGLLLEKVTAPFLQWMDKKILRHTNNIHFATLHTSSTSFSGHSLGISLNATPEIRREWQARSSPAA